MEAKKSLVLVLLLLFNPALSQTKQVAPPWTSAEVSGTLPAQKCSLPGKEEKCQSSPLHPKVVRNPVQGFQEFDGVAEKLIRTEAAMPVEMFPDGLKPPAPRCRHLAIHGPVEVREAVERLRSAFSPGGSISRPIRWPAVRAPTSFRFVGDTGPEPRRTVLHKGAIARIMCTVLFKSECGAIVSPLVSTAPFTFWFLPANSRERNPVAHG